MLQFGRHVEQTNAIQVYYGKGSGGKAPSRWKIFAIVKKITTLTSLERPTLASRVPLFLLGHFTTNECEISNFCLQLENGLVELHELLAAV